MNVITICAMIGSIILATLMLDVKSVRALIKMHVIHIIEKGGRSLSGDILSPILIDNLDTWLPFDIAKPPPRRNIKLHGIFSCKTFHVMSPSEGFVGLSFARGNC